MLSMADNLWASRISSISFGRVSLLSLLVLQLLSTDTIKSTGATTISRDDQQAQRINADKNVSNPLIYKRLRYDLFALQVYKRYQKHYAIDERKVSMKVRSQADGESNAIDELNYYENPQVEATSLTYDDLVFEALDRTYHSRLWPAYIYNYDNRSDLERASDKQKVSPARCERELSFLMQQLTELEEARAHSGFEGARLSNALNPELMAYFDAFGQEEQGLLLGNYHWTGGAWRECNKRLVYHIDKKNLSNSVEFNGRYCIASLRSQTWKAKAAQRAQEWDEIDQFRYPDQKYNYQRYFRLQVGICMPESCDSRSIETNKMDVLRLATHKLAQPMRSYYLADLYCLPDETSDLRQMEPAGKLFVLFAVVWLTLVVIFTWHDYLAHQSMKLPRQKTNGGGSVATRRASASGERLAGVWDKLTSSMSLIQNYERLVETGTCQPTVPLSVQLARCKQEQLQLHRVRKCGEKLLAAPATSTIGQGAPPAQIKLAPNDLLFLNFLKVFCMPLILFGHSGLQLKQLDRFALDFDCLWRSVAHFHFSAALFVDWFFVITGFLTTYIMFATNKVARNTTRDWLYSILHRYWRLAPLYILTFWFVQSVFMYTSSGPLWDYGSSNMTFRSICRRESLWIPLTLTSNLKPIHLECVVPTWYVSCDFQYYLILPFLLVLLHKSPLAGWLVSLGAIGASNSLRLHRYLTDRHAKPLDLMRPRYDLYIRNNWDMHSTYIHPQYRISPFLVGVLAGHYTFMVLSGRWRSFLIRSRAEASGLPQPGRIPRVPFNSSRLLLWLLGSGTLVALMWATSLVSNLFPVSLEPYALYFAALVYSNHHTFAALGLALFITTMMLGQFERLKQAMAAPVFTLMSRVNYLVFLIQLEVITWFMQSADHTEEQTNYVLFRYFFAMMAVVYPLAAFLTLALELPLSQLERNFVAPLFRSKPSGTSSSAHATTPADTNERASGTQQRSRESGEQGPISLS